MSAVKSQKQEVTPASRNNSEEGESEEVDDEVSLLKTEEEESEDGPRSKILETRGNSRKVSNAQNSKQKTSYT